MARRITKIKRVRFVSLVPAGANNLPVLYKSKDRVQLTCLTKVGADFQDKGELLSVVYAPNYFDVDDDTASANLVKDMAHAFAKEGHKLDVHHDGKALTAEQAFAAENFIIQPNDARFADFKDLDGEPVDVTGGWATLIKINDPALRLKFKNGELAGTSMEADAMVRTIKSKDEDLEGAFSKIIKSFASLLGQRSTESTDQEDEIDMKSEELETLLKANNTLLLAEVDKKLAPLKKGKAKDAEPDDETDDDEETEDETETPDDSETVKKLRKQLKAARKELAEQEAETDDETDGDEDDETDGEEDVSKLSKAALAKELKKSKARIAKLEKASGTASDETDGDEETEDGDIDPEMARLVKIGNRIGDAANRINRGGGSKTEDED